jgi:diacylglycerol kinase family enzyme
LVAASETLPRDEDHLARLRSDRSRFRETLSVARPRTYRIIADDVDLSGDYLLVEVLNVPFIGPRIRLNQKSNTSDGLLELVLVGERERADLLAILDAAPGATSVLLPCVQALRVQVASWDRSAHLDGQVLRVDYPDEKTFSLEIATRSTKLLVPRSMAGAPAATIAKRKGMHR